MIFSSSGCSSHFVTGQNIFSQSFGSRGEEQLGLSRLAGPQEMRSRPGPGFGSASPSKPAVLYSCSLPAVPTRHEFESLHLDFMSLCPPGMLGESSNVILLEVQVKPHSPLVSLPKDTGYVFEMGIKSS